MKSSSRAIVASLALVTACAPPPATPVPATPVSEPAVIDAASIRPLLEELASDAFAGREAGTPAELRSARFIADRLQAIGLEPAGDSGYFQRVPLTVEELSTRSTFSITRGGRTVQLPPGEAVVPLISLGEGVLARQRGEGDVVFVGHGVPDPMTRRDPLAGLSLRGKVGVVVMSAPPGSDARTREMLEGQEGLVARLQRLIPLEPAAIVMLFDGAAGEKLYGQFAPELMRSMSLGAAAAQPDDARRPVPLLVLGRLQHASALLPAQWPQDARAQELPARFVGNAVIERRAVTGYNVVGILRGSAPAMNSTFVALGAHHDHIGIEAPSAGDSIANGADDDGSGTVALLAVARAMHAGPRPQRSVLFIWHTAEEKGLLGSRHYTAQPTVPIDSIVAMINADMVGRNGGTTEDFAARGEQASEDRLFIVGPGAAPNAQSRVLGALVDSVNARLARPFTFDRTWDSPAHPERIYFRSDHYNYAQKGIPVIFFTSGLHPDYHKVSDEVSRIEWGKLARVAALMRDAATALANRPTRPR